MRATTKRWYAKFTSRILESLAGVWGLIERRKGIGLGQARRYTAGCSREETIRRERLRRCHRAYFK